MHPCVHSSISYSSQDVAATKVSMDGRMNKEDVVYIYLFIIYNGILLSHLKKRRNSCHV